LLLVSCAGSTSTEARDVREQVSALRLAGKLDEARDSAEAALKLPELSSRGEILMRLELAKISDRVGLHTNTRPVKATLQEIEIADTLEIEIANTLAIPLTTGLRAYINAAYATYYYRAEMSERVFAKADAYSYLAIAQHERAGNQHAQSDAVHQLGLIYLQTRDLGRARELFDESLRLDEEAGQRPWMLGEYHRHIAYIYVFSDDWASALPHFEKSLRYRIEAKAIDASLFAAISLGNALMKTGQVADAEQHLDFAMKIANEIHSPVGIARSAIVLATVYEQLERIPEARATYTMAFETSTAVGLTSVSTRAQAALGLLKD